MLSAPMVLLANSRTTAVIDLLINHISSKKIHENSICEQFFLKFFYEVSIVIPLIHAGPGNPQHVNIENKILE